MKRYTVLDERGNWYGPSIEAAHRRGYETHHIKRGHEAQPGGLGFLRPHAVPSVLLHNHADYALMSDKLTMVQDFDQVQLYDDKSAQFWRWAKWMPPTWRFDRLEAALEHVREYNGPIVSKADVGASSRNVRILHTKQDQMNHVKLLFGRGIEVDHCAGGGPSGREAKSKQKGYVLFQQYIPHNVTWRINIVGRYRSMFRRFNGPGGVAQTGNVEPVTNFENEDVVKVLAFADAFFAETKTKWCALDVLIDTTGEPRLLETSLGWPWPSPGECMSGPFVSPEGKFGYTWADMWDLMFDEYEAGVWTSAPTGPSTTSA